MGLGVRLLTTLLLLLAASCAQEGKVRERRMEPMPAYGAMVKKMQKESMGMPDPKVGAMVASMGPDSHPEEMGSYMEGDMFQPMNRDDLHPDIKFQFRWTDAVVPYRIDGQYDAKQRATIERAIGEYHKHTCVRFVPYSGQKDYIAIESHKSGCFSAVGRMGGKQVLNLQPPGCTYQVGTAIHELAHALGLFHEQSRADRDSFVHVAWDNIERGKEHNFKQHKYRGLGLPYDYGSVMHYSLNAFSKNKQNTMLPRQRSASKIGQRTGFSDVDIQRIRKLYGCDETKQPSVYRPPTPPPIRTPPPIKCQPPTRPPIPTPPSFPGKPGKLPWGKNEILEPSVSKESWGGGYHSKRPWGVKGQGRWDEEVQAVVTPLRTGGGGGRIRAVEEPEPDQKFTTPPIQPESSWRKLVNSG